MFKATISLIAVLMLCLGASKASALISDNFDSYTPGDAQANTNPTYWNWSFNGAYNSTWETNPLASPPTNAIVNEGGSHDNVLTVDTTNQHQFVPSFDWNPGVAYTGPNAMAFDIRISDPIGSNYFIGSNNGNTGQPFITLIPNGPANTVGTGAIAYASITGAPVIIPNMVVGVWYTIWIYEPVGNSSGDTVDFYVDKNIAASGVNSDPGAGNPVFGFSGQDSPNPEANTVSFDNIEFSNSPLEIVPEPASLGMLAVGGLILLKRRRA